MADILYIVTKIQSLIKMKERYKLRKLIKWRNALDLPVEGSVTL